MRWHVGSKEWGGNNLTSMKTKITALLLVAGALTTAAYAGTALNPSSSAGPAGLSSDATDQPKTDSSQQSTVGSS